MVLRVSLSFTLNAHDQNESGENFVAKWKEAYGEAPPVSLAAAIYDMVFMWAEAVEKTGDASAHQSVADAIRELNYDGVAGNYTFNERNFINTGSETQPAQLFQVQDKKRVRLVVGDEKVGEIQPSSWRN